DPSGIVALAIDLERGFVEPACLGHVALPIGEAPGRRHCRRADSSVDLRVRLRQEPGQPLATLADPGAELPVSPDGCRDPHPDGGLAVVRRPAEGRPDIAPLRPETAKPGALSRAEEVGFRLRRELEDPPGVQTAKPFGLVALDESLD